MGDDIEEHLKANTRAFDNLLSLHPAKLYHGEDTSDQWKRKKQTKEEWHEARKAKLDPENIKTAKDVMDEKERKRKREMGDEEFEDDQKTKAIRPEDQSRKKQRLNRENHVNGNHDKDAKVKAEKRKEKRQRKLEKKQMKKEKQDRNVKVCVQKAKAVSVDEQNGSDSDVEEEEDMTKDLEPIDISSLNEHIEVPTSPEHNSPAVDSTFSDNHAIASSTSSPPPVTAKSTAKDVPKPKPKFDHSALQERLKARIEELRAARKADGLNGKPARSRAELIEARRVKVLAKRAQKREAWKQQLSEQGSKTAAEAELAMLRGSGSPLTSGFLSPGVASPDGERKTNFTFGRVHFDDGSRLSLTNSLVDAKSKTKGPKDVRARLAAAEKKQEALQDMDESKRVDIEEKDVWLAARKKIAGEKVKDDVSLLKRTLKRREKAKAKSAKEWKAREEGVRKAEVAKQKKREENLAKRKEEKKRGKGKSRTGSNAANAAMKRAKYKAFGSSKPRP